jgi:uncharacterized protein YdhG (YjbR/CyaY superfamily)
MKESDSGTIDEYISAFPDDVRAILQKFRSIVRENAPGADEAIRYRMPTFRLKGKNLVHFAAFKGHIGFYPTPSGIESFKDDLARFEVSKGTIRFYLDRPIPYDLVARIVKMRVDEVMAKARK